MWVRRLTLRRRKRRDQEGVFVAASSSHGETKDAREEFASSTAVSPNLHTPMQSLSVGSGHLGVDAATSSAASGPSSSPFFSTRIQSLSERRSVLGSALEFEIESSKSHWTESSAATSDFDDEDQRVQDEAQRVRDSVAFEELKEHPEWGPFFRRQPYELEIGEKIAEGGQAEIFEALGTNKHEYARYVKGKTRPVAKVFKEGFCLEDVQRLWPPGLASAALPYRYFYCIPRKSDVDSGYGLCWSLGAQLLDDGRFAFIFDRFWGDFRKLIDKRMLKSNGAPPFSVQETHMILSNIAQGMVRLHKCGLLHKDLKAANVLTVCEDSGDYHRYSAFIADFESSAGIAGTGFWRAPEVLLALKNRSLVPETFTQQSDVYSYAMTCYEFLTGRVPFEGHPPNDYDSVLGGGRPPLPSGIYPAFKDLVRKCWHEDPLRRPSFLKIVADLRTSAGDVEYKFCNSPDYRYSPNFRGRMNPV